MRKQAFFALAIVAAGCSANPEADETVTVGVTAPTATPAQLRSFTNLQAESARSWTWVQHDRFGTPTHLSAARVGKPILVKGQDASKVTHEFLGQYKDLFRMNNPETELSPTKNVVDTLAMTHVRFQQMVRGVPVVGAELSAHYDATGRISSIDANYVPDLQGLDLEPKFEAKLAQEAALADVLGQMPGIDESEVSRSDGKLVVFALGERPATLAYEFELRAVTGNEPAIWITTVDAKTGEIIDRYNNLQTIEGSGSGVLGDTKKFQVTASGAGYVMTDTSRGVSIMTYTADNRQNSAQQIALPGRQVGSNSLQTWDQGVTGAGAAVDAHFNAGVVADYYKTKHARNSLDGKGGSMISTAHYGNNYDNAFWDGTQMAYGDGGQLFKPLSAGVDVVAHEFTHGVTTSTSNLRYTGQSGAMNEAVSDILGAMVEHYLKADDNLNWKMGEAIGKGGPLRDLKNPAAGNQPAHMSRYVNTQQDNGGVHINSGIPNNAAFLMTAGGTNPTSKVEVKFGIGFDKAEKLWYRANTQYFQTTTNFAQAAQGTLQAAKDLNLTTNEQNIVDCAWKAVGVVQGDCVALTDPKATTPPGTTPADPNSPGTGGTDTGDGTDGTGTGGSGTGTGTKAKRPVLNGQSSSGCNVSSTSGADFGPVAGVMMALVGLVSGRRKRR